MGSNWFLSEFQICKIIHTAKTNYKWIQLSDIWSQSGWCLIIISVSQLNSTNFFKFHRSLLGNLAKAEPSSVWIKDPLPVRIKTFQWAPINETLDYAHIQSERRKRSDWQTTPIAIKQKHLLTRTSLTTQNFFFTEIPNDMHHARKHKPISAELYCVIVCIHLFSAWVLDFFFVRLCLILYLLFQLFIRYSGYVED